jgi:2-succinyl-6-hydroxy-2,4-cyclohexadiene-1-carboxylate synthase
MTPLVCLHGFAGSPRCWDEVIEALGHPSKVLRPMLLGHNRAPPPASITSFEAEVDRVAALVVGAGLTGAHLVGYSLGARVGLGLLVRHGGLFARASLIGVHPGLASADERRARAAADKRWCRLLETRGIREFAEAWAAQPLFATQSRLPRARLDQQRRVRVSHDPAGLAGALRHLGLASMPCYRSQLRHVTLPVRVIAGELDVKFSELAREVAGLLPHGTPLAVAGAGHNPVLERPQQLAAQLQ